LEQNQSFLFFPCAPTFPRCFCLFVSDYCPSCALVSPPACGPLDLLPVVFSFCSSFSPLAECPSFRASLSGEFGDCLLAFFSFMGPLLLGLTLGQRGFYPSLFANCLSRVLGPFIVPCFSHPLGLYGSRSGSSCIRALDVLAGFPLQSAPLLSPCTSLRTRWSTSFFPETLNIGRSLNLF